MYNIVIHGGTGLSCPAYNRYSEYLSASAGLFFKHNEQIVQKDHLWTDTTESVTLGQQFSRCITYVSIIQIFR
jgi:hypothetical protein